MRSPHHPGRVERPQPQLPAFCRTRKLRSTPSDCRAGASQRLLYLVLCLQLSTILLVLAGPLPPPTPMPPPVGVRP